NPPLWVYVPGLNSDLALPRSHWSRARRTALRRSIGGLSQLGEEYYLLHQSDLYPSCLPCCLPFDFPRSERRNCHQTDGSDPPEVCEPVYVSCHRAVRRADP